MVVGGEAEEFGGFLGVGGSEAPEHFRGLFELAKGAHAGFADGDIRGVFGGVEGSVGDPFVECLESDLAAEGEGAGEEDGGDEGEGASADA